MLENPGKDMLKRNILFKRNRENGKGLISKRMMLTKSESQRDKSKKEKADTNEKEDENENENKKENEHEQ